MPSYLVETFLARGDTGERSARERRVHLAAEELTNAGTTVRLDQAIHVPEDEICFFVVSAPSSRDVLLLAQRARLAPLRVLETTTSTEE